eukprot:scaffold326647_cov28-Prasinocladus_malaysianus.AAC.1
MGNCRGDLAPVDTSEYFFPESGNDGYKAPQHCLQRYRFSLSGFVQTHAFGKDAHKLLSIPGWVA